MPPEAHVAEHFGTAEAQKQAGQFGMWIFLATELLLFTGLFVAYAFYRLVYPQDFHAVAAREMEVGIGTVNTFVLLSSSVLVALADTFIKRGQAFRTSACLLLAAAL